MGAVSFTSQEGLAAASAMPSRWTRSPSLEASGWLETNWLKKVQLALAAGASVAGFRLKGRAGELVLPDRTRQVGAEAELDLVAGAEIRSKYLDRVGGIGDGALYAAKRMPGGSARLRKVLTAHDDRPKVGCSAARWSIYCEA